VQVDSRLHCYDSAISSWLGGQHGQEAEDEVSGEEDCKENDEAEIREEEEVSRSTDRLRKSKTMSHEPAVFLGGG
jgi:hypothetical protein